MAAGTTQLGDVIEPIQFAGYVQLATQRKSRLIRSGAVATSSQVNSLLGGGGVVFHMPQWNDLDQDDDNVSTDDQADIHKATFGTAGGAARTDAFPFKITAFDELAVRLNRNAHWAASRLVNEIAASDPMTAIANRVANYWVERLQKIFVATWNGVIADNTANNGGDYTYTEAARATQPTVPAPAAPVLNPFTTTGFLLAKQTLGDSMDKVTLMMVHSAVFTRMKINQLIDFIPDARGEVAIPTFQGHFVIVDDNMPVDLVTDPNYPRYETWIFGAGATMFGSSPPPNAASTSEQEFAGNGGGEQVLHSRNQWTLHPAGHSFSVAVPPKGGPVNNTLALATTWTRVFPERKQVPFARYVSSA